MSGPDPTKPQGHRPVIDLRDPELLEAFYPAHYVDQRVYRSHFMEWDFLTRHTMDTSLGFPE
jgi:hypothetical protein